MYVPRVIAPSIPFLLALAACTTHDGDEDSAFDSGSPVGDTGETGETGEPDETGETGEVPSIFAPVGHPAAAWFTVPADRGLVWERDPTYAIEEFTVPQMVVMADGTLRMYATNMAATEGRWVMESENGVEWGTPTEALLPSAFLPLDCGDRLEDVAPHYRPGGLDLVAEGSYTPVHTEPAEWRKFCLFEGADPGPPVPDTAAFFYEGEAADNEQISVPSLVSLEDWSARLYYVGNLASPGEGIRVVDVSADGAAGASLSDEAVLASTDVDPLPIYLEGGGVRLFHTHGHGGGPGYADSVDGITFTRDTGLIPHEGEDCTAVGGECLLDPAFLHLPDDRLVLYFTRLEKQANGTFTARIERAFAMD